MEFKQLRFEHLVAGETRTIETCTDPAQILGRLKLLRRIAYLKLRGYDWHLIRRMYAAILTSIETAELSWESNFDRFENILYRRIPHEGRNTDREDKKKTGRDSAETTIGQRDALSPAHTSYGREWDTMQPKNWSITFVHHVSSETNNTKNTQKDTQSVPTEPD